MPPRHKRGKPVRPSGGGQTPYQFATGQTRALTIFIEIFLYIYNIIVTLFVPLVKTKIPALGGGTGENKKTPPGKRAMIFKSGFGFSPPRAGCG